MSLNWDISQVRDHKQVNANPLNPDEMHPVLHYLIFASIAVGLRGITEKNKDKFFQRVSLYQRMTGPAVEFGDGTKVYVTKADVERYVGLVTNVSDESDTWFMKKVLNWAARDYKVSVYDNPGHKLSALDYIEHRAEAHKAMKEDQYHG